ncbi:hypothetical protein F5879DRAFT_996218 [Lentinula edodes]|nr:hypothetical protein F5879DRAFT_996218 [Lentinula edodes]
MSFEEEDNGESKEDEAVETAIWSILGHKWIGQGLMFMVEWIDNDVTWESLLNIKDCVALDDYLVHHGLAEPSKLSKKMYLFYDNGEAVPTWLLLVTFFSTLDLQGLAV